MSFERSGGDVWRQNISDSKKREGQNFQEGSKHTLSKESDNPESDDILDSESTLLLPKGTLTAHQSSCLPSPWPVVMWPVNQLDQFICAAAPYYLFSQFVPNAPQEYDLMVKTGSFALSYLLQDTVTNLKFACFQNREDFAISALSFAKRKYFLSAVVGMVVLGGATAGAFFGLPEVETMINDLLNSEDDHLKLFAETMQYAFENREAILGSMVGTVGYLSYRLPTAGMRKLLDCTFPEWRPLELSNTTLDSKDYAFGNYVFRLFNRVTVTEAALFGMRFFGQSALAANTPVQLGILFGTELVFKAVDYMNRPALNTISDRDNSDDYDDDDESTCEKLKSVCSKPGEMLKAVVKEGIKFGFGYGVVELAVNYFQLDLGEDTLGNRAAKMAVAEAIAQPLVQLSAYAFATLFCKQKTTSAGTNAAPAFERSRAYNN